MPLWKGNEWYGNNGMLVYGCKNIYMIYVYGYIKAKGAGFNGKGLDAEESWSNLGVWR